MCACGRCPDEQSNKIETQLLLVFFLNFFYSFFSVDRIRRKVFKTSFFC